MKRWVIKKGELYFTQGTKSGYTKSLQVAEVFDNRNMILIKNETWQEVKLMEVNK